MFNIPFVLPRPEESAFVPAIHCDNFLDSKSVEQYRRPIKLTVEELNKVKDIKCRLVVRPVRGEPTKRR